MTVNLILWLAAIGTCAALAGQWIMLRSRYLNGLTVQRARHQQQMQSTQAQLEHAKQQIGHLQHALTVARMQAKRQLAAQELAAQQPATPPQRARAEAPAPRRALPKDGFADTLPTPQYPHEASLLKH